MDPLITQLMHAAAQSPKHLESLLDQSKSNLSPELAATARQAFKQAISAREGGKALAATMVASGIYSRLGDRPNVLRNQLDFWQVQFMMAETAEQYSLVRENSIQVITKADELPAPRLAFEASVLAADCSHFAAEAASGLESRQWRSTTLRDLVVACDRAANVEHDFVFVKFVDLLATAVSRTMSTVFLEAEQSQLDDLLRRISVAVEKLVPPDFEFPGDPLKTTQIAAILAELADSYGP